MKIVTLIFLCGLASDFLLSEELFRGENLLVKTPDNSDYKAIIRKAEV